MPVKSFCLVILESTVLIETHDKIPTRGITRGYKSNRIPTVWPLTVVFPSRLLGELIMCKSLGVRG